MKAAIVPFVILFLTSFGVFTLLRAWRRGRTGMSRSRLQETLRKDAPVSPEEKALSLEARERALSELPFLQTLLARLSFTPRLERLLGQADVGRSVGEMVLLILFLALIGFLAGSMARLGPALSLAGAGLAGALPVLYLGRRKARRIEAFQRQLPEALDLIGRALRAGHAFSSGMKLAAENFKDPLGREFTKTVGEIQFGTPVPDALKNLSARMDCPDLKFFVVAVILQRETGGNLAEIIESMSRIIRERFAFEEKVHALSAEGRISAKIIAGLVVTIVGMLYMVDPTHFDPLLQNPTGRVVAMGAAASVVLGIVIMNRMSNSVKL